LRTKGGVIFSADRGGGSRVRLQFRTTPHAMDQRAIKPPSVTARYAVELVRDPSRGSGIEAVLGQESNLKTALVRYNLMVAHYPGRLVMLCDRARVLARSDRPDTMAAS
jgi:hypothetical protein